MCVWFCIYVYIIYHKLMSRWECAVGLYKIHGAALKAMCWPSALWPEINMVVIRRNISYNISHEIWMWVWCALFSLGVCYISWWFLVICSTIFVNIQSMCIDLECCFIVLSAQVIYVDGLAQDCSISSALAMEIMQSCSKLSMYCHMHLCISCGDWILMCYIVLWG